jgi:shikimate dehydrogenase
MKPHSFSNGTKILGILGNPLSHTLSPTIHNQFYQDLNLDYVYLVFDKKNPTKQELLTLHDYGLEGLSVTIPYKEWAYEIADSRDSYSEVMKSSNTLVFQNGKIHSYNTDGIGAVASIEKDHSSFLKRDNENNILICGSGGSARGISFAILEEWNKTKTKLNLDSYESSNSSDKNDSSLDPTKKKNQLWIVSRNTETSKRLASDLNHKEDGIAKAIEISNLSSIQNTVQLIIHTTPLGMLGKEQKSFLPSNFISSSMTVFDIVYNPQGTVLIQEAKKKGADIIYGIEMLLYQAIRQHELFTKTSPNSNLIDKVRNLLYSKLNN